MAIPLRLIRMLFMIICTSIIFSVSTTVSADVKSFSISNNTEQAVQIVIRHTHSLYEPITLSERKKDAFFCIENGQILALFGDDTYLLEWKDLRENEVILFTDIKDRGRKGGYIPPYLFLASTPVDREVLPQPVAEEHY